MDRTLECKAYLNMKYRTTWTTKEHSKIKLISKSAIQSKSHSKEYLIVNR